MHWRRKPDRWKIEGQANRSSGQGAREEPCWVTGETGQRHLSVLQEEMTQRRGSKESKVSHEEERRLPSVLALVV